MRVAIASGKGGTGKTLVATNLAAALGAAYVDCDVEGANGHLFLQPRINEERPAETPVPSPNDRCTGCGACAEACRFGAIAVLKGAPLVFGELCHSCGACLRACPEGALAWSSHALGKVRTGTYCPDGARRLPFADGELATGEVRASAVIRQVKASADPAAPITVLDCPPGAGCALTEAVTGADACLLVTEPTPMGLSDLGGACELVLRLGIPHAVILNRCDLGGADADGFCRDRGVPIVARIPHDDDLARLYARGQLAYLRCDRYKSLFDSIASGLSSGALALRRPREAAPAPAPLLSEAAVPGLGGRPEAARGRALLQVAIVSGKGGAGKTSLAVSLAGMAAAFFSADCDVEGANMHLLLSPSAERSVAFSGGYAAVVRGESCSGCGVCAGECRFGAISLTPRASVDSLRCEGCGLCAMVCPLGDTEEPPIALRPRLHGHAFVGQTPFGGLARGALLPGGEASGKLVTLVRALAEDAACGAGARGILIDAAPGTGCPVNAALTGTDFAVAVAEPTPSGLHDLTRVLDLADWFGVPAACVINKADVCQQVADTIGRLCRDRGVELLGSIPFDRRIPADLAAGRIPLLGDGPGAAALSRICRVILARLQQRIQHKAGGRAASMHTGRRTQ